jgi:predicted ATPase
LGVVERIGGSQPLLLVFEDLHWADQSTLDLLAHLVRAAAGGARPDHGDVPVG